MVLGREAVDIWLLWSHGYRITTIEGSVNLMLLVCIPCLRCILWIWNIVLSSLHAFLCLWCIKHEFSWEKFTLVDILFELQIHYTQSTHYTSAVTSRCADEMFQSGASSCAAWGASPTTFPSRPHTMTMWWSRLLMSLPPFGIWMRGFELLRVMGLAMDLLSCAIQICFFFMKCPHKNGFELNMMGECKVWDLQ